MLKDLVMFVGYRHPKSIMGKADGVFTGLGAKFISAFPTRVRTHHFVNTGQLGLAMQKWNFAANPETCNIVDFGYSPNVLAPLESTVQ